VHVRGSYNDEVMALVDFASDLQMSKISFYCSLSTSLCDTYRVTVTNALGSYQLLLFSETSSAAMISMLFQPGLPDGIIVLGSAEDIADVIILVSQSHPSVTFFTISIVSSLSLYGALSHKLYLSNNIIKTEVVNFINPSV